MKITVNKTSFARGGGGWCLSRRTACLAFVKKKDKVEFNTAE